MVEVERVKTRSNKNQPDKTTKTKIRRTIMTDEMTILSDGVIFDDFEIEEMEEVVAPAGLITA
jgi:hypothetical protein